MRQSYILIICFVIFVLAFLGYSLWQSNVQTPFSEVSKEKQEEDLRAAEKYLQDADPERSLPIIHSHKEEMEKVTEAGKKWLNLFVEASTQLEDTDQLMMIYHFSPNSISNHERGALALADAFLKGKEEEKYKAIREEWRNRETDVAAWTLLDADALLQEGNKQQAYAILKDQKWSGYKEEERLMRLAMLKMHDQPEEALEIINSALSKDKQNPEMLAFRARIYESLGQCSKAENDFTAATAKDPTDIYLQDQLAEFYRRQKNYTKALNIWQKLLSHSSNEQVWMKNIFWSQIASPIKYDWKHAQLPETKSRAFLVYALSLKPGEYWDAQAFEKIPNHLEALSDYQATYWMRLLQALKMKDEKTAEALLRNNIYQENSWAPLLELTLRRIINYRQNGSLLVEGDVQNAESLISLLSKKGEIPELYQEIDTLAQKEADNGADFELSDTMKNLLNSDEVFAVALLSEGWTEAALQMQPAKKLSDNIPDWVSALYIQALRQNRGDQVALKYASMQEQTPIVTLLTAEMEIDLGKVENISKLEKLVSSPGEIGARAAWIISLADIKKGQYDKAKKAIESNAMFLHSLQGQEALGRIAMLQGKPEEAASIYRTIVHQSNEAKSFLARLAYQQKDWSQARLLTEELLKEFPQNRQLQENLKKIIIEENAHKLKS